MPTLVAHCPCITKLLLHALAIGLEAGRGLKAGEGRRNCDLCPLPSCQLAGGGVRTRVWQSAALRAQSCVKQIQERPQRAPGEQSQQSGGALSGRTVPPRGL